MAEHVCPWWIGYFLISPIRRWAAGSAEETLAPHIKDGMTVVEPGPGMGFFTLPMARMVGRSGRVVAIDIQPKMLENLRRRGAKSGVLDRIETRLVHPDSLGIGDLTGSVDFVWAFAMVHEIPSLGGFFSACATALRPGGRLLLAEPVGHVKPDRFAMELASARAAGLEMIEEPRIRRSLTALFEKPEV